MRDKRFLATHRGGSLDLPQHRCLAIWAADCAGHVLPLFEERNSDERPRKAIELTRAWARAEVSVGGAQKAAYAAHAAARESRNPAARAAARAAGHAAATAHFADHSVVAAIYALQAVQAASQSPQEEQAWQMACLPGSMRELVISAVARRFPKFGLK